MRPAIWMRKSIPQWEMGMSENKLIAIFIIAVFIGGVGVLAVGGVAPLIAGVLIAAIAYAPEKGEENGR